MTIKSYIGSLSLHGNYYGDDLSGYVTVQYKDDNGDRVYDSTNITLNQQECEAIVAVVHSIVDARKKALAKMVEKAEFTPLLSGPIVDHTDDYLPAHDNMGNRLDGTVDEDIF